MTPRPRRRNKIIGKRADPLQGDRPFSFCKENAEAGDVSEAVYGPLLTHRPPPRAIGAPGKQPPLVCFIQQGIRHPYA